VTHTHNTRHRAGHSRTSRDRLDADRIDANGVSISVVDNGDKRTELVPRDDNLPD